MVSSTRSSHSGTILTLSKLTLSFQHAMDLRSFPKRVNDNAIQKHRISFRGRAHVSIYVFPVLPWPHLFLTFSLVFILPYTLTSTYCFWFAIAHGADNIGTYVALSKNLSALAHHLGKHIFWKRIPSLSTESVSHGDLALPLTFCGHGGPFTFATEGNWIFFHPSYTIPSHSYCDSVPSPCL